MAKKFKNLVEKMGSERRAEMHLKAEELNKEIALKELRESKEITQESLAGILGVNQAAISKFEKRGNSVSVSSMDKYASALGGILEIRISFPKTGEEYPIKVKEDQEEIRI